jgi:nucleoside-diphosphate-sugar epimerase
MIKVAVLGANGFIGTRIVEMFALNHLADVHPVVRDYAGLARSSRFDLEGRVANAFDAQALHSAFEGCDVVVHAVAGDMRTILGTLTPSYQAAQKAGVRRFVYLSSGSVHGQSPQPGTDESSPLSTRQDLPYNNAKVHAERTLTRLRNQGNVELVILRPGIVFGPRSSWVTHFAEDLLAGKAALLNHGKGICNSIYVDNLVHAIYLAATQPHIDGEVFLLGDEECVTWADLYRPIATALGYDFEHIPEGIIASQRESLFARLEPIRVSKTVQGLLSVIPHKFRLAAFRAYETILQYDTIASGWPQAGQQISISYEMGALYSCAYKLPHDKATLILGYQPPVSFEQACRHTVAWLGFAGFPVKSDFVETNLT